MSSEAKRAYERDWRQRKYASDPEYRARKQATDKAWRDRLREELRQFKLTTGCSRCGYDKCARALAFHHRDPNKEITIANKISLGRKKLWEEVAKCDVLCANCHAETHCEAC
jgi:hypothetical protein